MSILALAAPVTHALDVNGRPQYGEVGRKAFWYGDLIEGFMVEVDNPLALDALEVLVVGDIGVKTLGAARPLHHEGHAHVAQRQQRPVDGIQGDAGEDLAHPAKDHLRGGMLIRLQKGSVDRHTLGRDFQPFVATLHLERIHPSAQVLSVDGVGLAIHPYPPAERASG